LALAGADARVSKTPTPIVRVSALNERGVELALGFNVNSHIDGGMVEESLRRGLLKQFREAKIEIAYYKSSQGVPSGSPV
jgi:small-conductance mechanosensitive channel